MNAKKSTKKSSSQKKNWRRIEHIRPDEVIPSAILDAGMNIPGKDRSLYMAELSHCLDREAGEYYIPDFLLKIFAMIVKGKAVNAICDPWAMIGRVIGVICDNVKSNEVIAITKNEKESKVGDDCLMGQAEWRVGDPLQILQFYKGQFDIVASVLPFGIPGSSIELPGKNGSAVTFSDDLGFEILAAASVKLSENGIGVFVLPQRFFKMESPTRKNLPALGLSVLGAFALPSGTFAPVTNISTYMVIITKKNLSQMFVAQLSTDTKTNQQIIANFQNGREGTTYETGRFVEIEDFKGISNLCMNDRINEAKRRFDYPAILLGEIAKIKLGRADDKFEFSKIENAIFIPVIGNSDVIDSIENAKLKLQNYAQCEIDPKKANGQFVARFLNSELGKEIREYNQSGIIPKLNTQALKNMEILVPDISIQREILNIEARLVESQNIIAGLNNEALEYIRLLWEKPESRHKIDEQIESLSFRLSGEISQQNNVSFENWYETLPFPLASILRAWQATSIDDLKTKNEHLLDFFQASAQFLGIIYLSAFNSREKLFADFKSELERILEEGHLSLKLSTFGTWKTIIEYLGKQVRNIFAENASDDDRKICAEMFADTSLQLPLIISRLDLIDIFTTANKIRNNWKGHGGVIGPGDARTLNNQLLLQIQKYREITGDIWSNIQLVHSQNCRLRSGSFEHEIEIMMGSHNEFKKEKRILANCLDSDYLYLVGKEGNNVLKLLRLVQIGPTPASVNNACYFFNRFEKSSLRYVSYHYLDKSERNYSMEEVKELLPLFIHTGDK